MFIGAAPTLWNVLIRQDLREDLRKSLTTFCFADDLAIVVTDYGNKGRRFGVRT